MKFKVQSSKFKVALPAANRITARRSLALPFLILTLSAQAAGVSTNKFMVVGANNVLPPNETNFFQVNSNLLNASVAGGGGGGGGGSGSIFNPANFITNGSSQVDLGSAVALAGGLTVPGPLIVGPGTADIIITNSSLGALIYNLGPGGEFDLDWKFGGVLGWSLQGNSSLLQLQDGSGANLPLSITKTNDTITLGGNAILDSNLTVNGSGTSISAAWDITSGRTVYAVTGNFGALTVSTTAGIGGTATAAAFNGTNQSVQGPAFSGNGSGLTNLSAATATLAANLQAGAITTNIYNTNSTGSGNTETNLTAAGSTLTVTATTQTNTGAVGIAGSAIIGGQLSVGTAGSGGGFESNSVSITNATPVVIDLGNHTVTSNLTAGNTLTGGLGLTNNTTNSFTGNFSPTNWFNTNHYSYDFTNTVTGAGAITQFFTNAYVAPCYYMVSSCVTAVCRTNIAANYSQWEVYWVTNTAAGCYYENKTGVAGNGGSPAIQAGAVTFPPANTNGSGLYWYNGSGATNTVSVVAHVEVYFP
jgi:hypothetical protein